MSYIFVELVDFEDFNITNLIKKTKSKVQDNSFINHSGTQME